MPSVTPAVLASLQANTKNIRNICVLAHVDHGKTSLSDGLIASNGIISAKMAGKLRYLDSRPDEQERGITMKSSSISLLYQKKDPDAAEKDSNYLINLIDSPGHVDFSSEVSTAVRITDGALVLVDVVEGVCIQTHAVLRQAWLEKVRPTLVLNKIDRLITELHMTPLEAYQHMAKVLEQVNVVTGTLFNENVTKKLDKEASNENQDEVQDEIDDSDLYFSPDQGNVAFGCATDGWAFRIDQFSDLYSKKLGMKKSILQKTLWGEYYFSMKDKKIYKKPRGSIPPMFVQFVLDSIWKVYNAALSGDKERIEKIVSTLSLKVNPRDLASRDNKQVMQGIMQAWLPLSDSILAMVVEKLPDPIVAQSTRMDHLFIKHLTDTEVAAKQGPIEKNLHECSSEGEVVVFVSKVVAVPKDIINAMKPRMPQPRRIVPRQEGATTTTTTTSSSENNNKEETKEKEKEKEPEKKEAAAPIPTPAPEPVAPKSQTYVDRTGEAFVAFSRIFSGTIRKDQTLYILHPRFDPAHPENYVTEAKVEQLYMLMGRSLEPVDSVPAGNVFGIGGDIGAQILKTATISSSLACPSFTKMHFVSSPIVRVAVEPTNPVEMPILVEGFKHLNQADPSVEVLVQDTGEHVVIAAGELHLERCLRDLREIFCKIDLQVSAPIVPFRETIISNSAKTNPVTTTTPNRLLQIKARAIPLPDHISKFLESHAAEIKQMLKVNKERKEEQNLSPEFKEKFLEELKLSGESWAKEIDNIWAFGPRRVGPNILLNHIPEFSQTEYFRSVFAKLGKKAVNVNVTIEAAAKDAEEKEEKEKEETQETEEKPAEVEEKAAEETSSEHAFSDTDSVKSNQKQRSFVSREEKMKLLKDLDHSIISGFQLAALAGPLCEEPMMGMCCIVEDVIIYKPENPKEVTQSGPLSGQVISTMKEATRLAFQSADMRLLEANYECEVQVSSDALGKVYAVLSKRRAKIVKEGMKEGTPIFSIQAKLPVVESFGFSDQLLKQTSGAASAQLLFENDWTVLEQDPYYQPKTEEEFEESGTNIASLGTNIARKYMDQVRRRKGLAVEEKVVEHGEKQRTLKKNK